MSTSTFSIIWFTDIYYCGDPEDHIGNFCSDEPWLNADGTADGEVIFVRTNCADRTPLGMGQQDPVYQQPGVPLDRGTLANILASWETDSCDVSYKFLFDEFEVRGKDWDDNQLGANGEGLMDAIQNCGAITNWNFQWTPDDPNYDWYASGNLPIGVKSCVGSAVVRAGGPNAKAEDCVGAG